MDIGLALGKNLRILSKKLLQRTFLFTFCLIGIASYLNLRQRDSAQSYDNEAQFSDNIAALGIIGKSRSNAVTLLEVKGFNCDSLECSRFTGKSNMRYWLENKLFGDDKDAEVGISLVRGNHFLLSCPQKQDLELTVNEQDRVVNFSYAIHRVQVLHKPQWCDKYHEKLDGKRSLTQYQLSDDNVLD